MSRYIRSLPYAALFAMLLLGLGIYCHGSGDYWLYDDHPNLVNNPDLQLDGSELDDWRTAALSSGSGPLRRPVAMISFAANAVVSGELDAPILKMTNVVIHALAVLALWGFFSTLLRYFRSSGNREWAPWLALAAAVAWGLHPLHVSTVLYPVQRMAQLSALFVITGLWLFAYYRNRWSESGGTPGEVIAAALWLGLITACAVLSKENGILLLWMMAALEFAVYRGRWRGHDLPWLRRCAATAVVVPALVLLAVFAVAPDWLVSRYSMREFDLYERVQTQLRLLWIYLRWLLLPDITQYGLHHDAITWSRTLFNPVTTVLALLAWVGMLLTALWKRREHPLFLLAVLFYLVGHSMESSVWPLLMVFEHRNYLPGIGVYLALMIGLVGALQRSQAKHPVLPILFLPLVLLAMLALRVNTWSSQDGLGEAGVRHHPDSSLSHYVYANDQLRDAESGAAYAEHVEAVTLARYHFEQASRLDPRDLGALVTLHQLDSTYFSGLANRTDWLAKIEQILIAAPLSKKDAAALENLMSCLGDDGCAGGEVAYRRVSDLLASRFPRWSQRYVLEHVYATKSQVSAVDRIPILQAGLAQHPGHVTLLHKALADAVEIGDMGLVYDLALQLYQADPMRYQLSRMTTLFPATVRLEHRGN
ncbi:hypothetical protein EY643_04690 [Halioglobus maricola]|uniref:Tetratricopeptide repeat protein n=1 Tax=Halioglobus maricola TaxID=2601894 RepID=A0A5P9NGQ3_9GAMM|nr:hypothetical protein [Halioglobus maricola]QFU74997.1 hypothetical protein EY643_04690 [Halioglobus maricola]